MSHNPVDQHVGMRVRQRRTLMGLSQEKLGEAIGLTFQQVQKYERGANRIGCSRLFDLSRVLQVPVSFFFEEMPEAVADSSPASLAAGATPATVADDPMTKRETLEFVRAYQAIPNDLTRKRVYSLVKALAGDREPEAA